MRGVGRRARATTTRATSATSTSRSCSASETPCSGKRGVTVVAVDSTEPDLDHGQIGRGRYGWIEEEFAAEPATLASSCCTIICCRSPARAVSATSSTTPAMRSSACSGPACNLVLSGHKHVPYAWKLENLFVVNTGTVSTLRLEGQHATLLQRRRGRGHRTSRSGAGTRSTGRSGSSSSTSRPASTRSTPAGSSKR